MDPVVQFVLRAVLGLLFASAAWHKLRDMRRFRSVLEDYAILPAAVVPAGAACVAIAELAIACMMASGSGVRSAAVAAASLLLVYASAIFANVRRGRTGIDCGCAGPAAGMPLSAGLVLRNVLVAAASLVLVVPAAARVLTTLDMFAVVASTAVLSTSWMAGQRLLVLAPRVAAARRRSA